MARSREELTFKRIVQQADTISVNQQPTAFEVSRFGMKIDGLKALAAGGLGRIGNRLVKDKEIHVARSLRSRHIICFELSRKSRCMEFKTTERGGESGLSREIRQSRREFSDQARSQQEQRWFPYRFTVKLNTGFSTVGKAMPMTPSGNGIG